MDYYAHISEAGDRQLMLDHARKVSAMAGEFASSFGAPKEAEQIGLAHDIGKYSAAFQNRLLNQGPKVDHSTAGAAELWKKRDIPGAFCVAGHHSGLPDLGSVSDNEDLPTLHGRLRRHAEGRLQDYSAYSEEIVLGRGENPGWAGKPLNAYFYIKMLFSCLVDADFLDTEQFVQHGKRPPCSEDSMDLLWGRLLEKIKSWGEPSTQLNRIRNEILEQCIGAGKSQKGLYSLTVPTGGGKTISSLAFALQQAICHKDIRRIIYVIPYTSIIDQNAAVFEQILGEHNVLAHYSEADYEDGDEQEELNRKKRLATENWDVPVVVTTSVQFFESMFSHKTSKNRKLHNIVNSVLVFDEYQMLPTKHIKPCTEAIYQLVKNYGCTALICTATQPGTDRFFHGMPCREIIEDVPKLFEQLKRVTYRLAGKYSTEQLSEELMKAPQMLCIVNTRKAAQEVFHQLEGQGNYHLSTLMTPKHRRKTLEEIRRRLDNELPCRVISTSLIEAGVDVSFPIVYREENGLDSIVQAAGRCNREGDRDADDSVVWVFSLERPCPVMQRANRDSMRETLQLGYEIGSPEAIKKYFHILYDVKGEDALDAEQIIEFCERGGIHGLFPFRTISERFRMIDEDTKTVYIPYDEAGALLTRRLAAGERTRELFRKLGQYGVNLYPQYYDKLRNCGAVLEYDESAVILSDLSLYSHDTGLQIPENEVYSGFFV